MSKKNEKPLSNPEYVFTLLTAIVKKNNGVLRISEKDLISVTTKDIVKLLWDENSSEVVLRIESPLANLNYLKNDDGKYSKN